MFQTICDSHVFVRVGECNILLCSRNQQRKLSSTIFLKEPSNQTAISENSDIPRVKIEKGRRAINRRQEAGRETQRELAGRLKDDYVCYDDTHWLRELHTLK